MTISGAKGRLCSISFSHASPDLESTSVRTACDATAVQSTPIQPQVSSLAESRSTQTHTTSAASLSRFRVFHNPLPFSTSFPLRTSPPSQPRCPRSSPPIRSSASSITTEFPRITHMPSLTFSPFGLLSVASSSTMLRKTYTLKQPQQERSHDQLSSQSHIQYLLILSLFLSFFSSYIITTKGTHHLPRAVELHFDALVEVLLCVIEKS